MITLLGVVCDLLDLDGITIFRSTTRKLCIGRTDGVAKRPIGLH